MFITAGLHVPVIGGALVELPGRVGAVEFSHNGPIGAKVGNTGSFITMVIVVCVAHIPAPGVKV